ncbi:MAG TPA: hypothetical protein DEB17_03090 [Chlorobaculum sp.]|uniref:HMA domain-containing protein n=1 Tax=Chlorobaculum tepidum (strain ATCC 49652 / DSM 12025 / NBRC 103806 / TLS) TaxID=194439 RepID=Q8KE73_CHLTE|nr:hypothetical protein CT0817 [Chlorobaculum tepidum TLS]HBU22971.1 hypothetical protein [Chlorobaculum sp.]
MLINLSGHTLVTVKTLTRKRSGNTNMKRKIYGVSGMHCASCEAIIEKRK